MSWLITGAEKNPVDLYRSQVSLLLHGDGANGSTTITDNSPTPKIVTAVGNAQISTAQSKFGGASIAFDGTEDYLTIPANSAFAFGTSDFTIEAFVYINQTTLTTGSSDAVIAELRSTGGTATGFVFNLGVFSDGFSLNFYTDGGRNAATAKANYGEWHHIAAVRSGSTVTLFSGGTNVKSITKTNNFSDTPNLRIGASGLYGNSSISGYIDDLRITKGVARYTSNFTPPTAPFPDI
jgi:hypothetical protein